mmetsp:Transcript_7271/g.25990  ORF Transcript_7271/g.25990 Transcript_7271/m.25990 type:complete len:766 (-) Transcript_7271:4868-7165(-)
MRGVVRPAAARVDGAHGAPGAVDDKRQRPHVPRLAHAKLAPAVLAVRALLAVLGQRAVRVRLERRRHRLRQRAQVALPQALQQRLGCVALDGARAHAAAALLRADTPLADAVLEWRVDAERLTVVAAAAAADLNEVVVSRREKLRQRLHATAVVRNSTEGGDEHTAELSAVGAAPQPKLHARARRRALRVPPHHDLLTRQAHIAAARRPHGRRAHEDVVVQAERRDARRAPRAHAARERARARDLVDARHQAKPLGDLAGALVLELEHVPAAVLRGPPDGAELHERHRLAAEAEAERLGHDVHVVAVHRRHACIAVHGHELVREREVKAAAVDRAGLHNAGSALIHDKRHVKVAARGVERVQVVDVARLAALALLEHVVHAERAVVHKRALAAEPAIPVASDAERVNLAPRVLPPQVLRDGHLAAVAAADARPCAQHHLDAPAARQCRLALAVRLAKDVAEDVGDADRALRVPAVAGDAGVIGEAELDAACVSEPTLRKARVPHLIGVLDEHTHVGPQRVADQLRHRLDVGVVGGVRHVEPRRRANDVGQLDLVLERHAVDVAAAAELLARPRAVAPLHLGGVVGARPVHEAQRAEAVQALEEERVEGHGGRRVRKARHHDADVADRVRRVHASHLQPKAVLAAVRKLERVHARNVGRRREPHRVTARVLLNDLSVHAEFESAVAVEEHGVKPRWRVQHHVAQHELADARAVLERHRPPIAVNDGRGSVGPAVLHFARLHLRVPVGHPVRRGDMHIHERPLRAPV